MKLLSDTEIRDKLAKLDSRKLREMEERLRQQEESSMTSSTNSSTPSSGGKDSPEENDFDPIHP